jgi:hypothetical protein
MEMLPRARSTGPDQHISVRCISKRESAPDDVVAVPVEVGCELDDVVSHALRGEALLGNARFTHACPHMRE